MENRTIFWADNDTQDAIELDYYDLEQAAALLNVSIDNINSCTRGEMSFYRVSLKNDPFSSL